MTLKLIQGKQINANLTGSFSGSFTGNLIGTSSWASNAISSSYAVSSSFTNTSISASYSISSSQATSASFALTASYLSGYVSPFPFTGSAIITGSLQVTGSVSATQGFTGSLFGTSSFALGGSGSFSGSFSGSGANLNSIPASAIVGLNLSQIATGSVTASVTPTQFSVISGSITKFQVTGTGVTVGNATTDIHRVTGSLNVTGSSTLRGTVNITPATSTTNSLVVTGPTLLSGSQNTISGSVLTVVGSGSAQPVFTVQGSQGELFSVTDSLSGSLFSVNDISGLPIMEVFSDGTTLIGDYLDPMLITTKKVTLTNSGTFTIYSLPTASYDTAFFDYSVRSGSNARAGQIMAIQSGTSVNYTETTTMDFGSTSGVSLGVFVSGSNMVLTGSAATSAWTIKTIVRSL
jgi:hypothetical protein